MTHTDTRYLSSWPIFIKLLQLGFGYCCGSTFTGWIPFKSPKERVEKNYLLYPVSNLNQSINQSINQNITIECHLLQLNQRHIILAHSAITTYLCPIAYYINQQVNILSYCRTFIFSVPCKCTISNPDSSICKYNVMLIRRYHMALFISCISSTSVHSCLRHGRGC